MVGTAGDGLLTPALLLDHTPFPLALEAVYHFFEIAQSISRSKINAALSVVLCGRFADDLITQSLIRNASRATPTRRNQ